MRVWSCIIRSYCEYSLLWLPFRWADALILTTSKSQEMVEEADRNNDGVIDKEEFFRVMRKRGDDPLDDLDSDSDF